MRLCGLSMAELGLLMGRASGGREYSRQSVNNWAKGRVPMCGAACLAFARVIINNMPPHAFAIVRWQRKNKFRVKVFRLCAREGCANSFEWTDARIKKCRRCRK